MRKLIGLGIGLFFLAGCATFRADPPEVKAAKSLAAMGELLKAAGETGDRLCDQKLIKAESCGKMRDVWRQVRPAYVSAVDSTIFGVKYAATDGTAIERMKANQAEFFALYADFMALAAELNLLGGKE